MRTQGVVAIPASVQQSAGVKTVGQDPPSECNEGPCARDDIHSAMQAMKPPIYPTRFFCRLTRIVAGGCTVLGQNGRGANAHMNLDLARQLIGTTVSWGSDLPRLRPGEGRRHVTHQVVTMSGCDWLCCGMVGLVVMASARCPAPNCDHNAVLDRLGISTGKSGLSRYQSLSSQRSCLLGKLRHEQE